MYKGLNAFRPIKKFFTAYIALVSRAHAFGTQLANFMSDKQERHMFKINKMSLNIEKYVLLIAMKYDFLGDHIAFMVLIHVVNVTF